MADVKKVEKGKRGIGFYVGWVGIPTVMAGGAVLGVFEAIAQKNAPLGISSGIAIAALTYVLLRRFA